MKPNSEDIVFFKNYIDNKNSSIASNDDENYIEIPENFHYIFRIEKK